MTTSLDSGDDPPSCCNCKKFWGPLRPFFGHHNLKESSTSVFFPTLAVILWRVFFAAFFAITVIYYLVTGEYEIVFYSIWSHLGVSLAFASLALNSITYYLTRSSEGYKLLPNISVPLFQVFATAALFLDVVYWSLLFEYDSAPSFPQLVQHLFNLIAVLLDMFLTMRIEFRVSYAFLFVSYTCLFVGFAWVRFWITDDWVYQFLDYRGRSAGITLAYYLGVIAWGFAASFIMIALSRISRLKCIQRERADNTFSEIEVVAE